MEIGKTECPRQEIGKVPYAEGTYFSHSFEIKKTWHLINLREKRQNRILYTKY